MNDADMNEPDVGGTALRAMLERATADEPLIGPVVQNALVAGLKRRRRRRASGIVACAVVVAAVSVIAPALTGARRVTPASVTQASTPTVYVANRTSGVTGWVTPISTVTNKAGPRIDIGLNYDMAVTPNGKTIYFLDLISDTVTPVSTATNTAGRPIKVARFPFAIAITPDGKFAYVLSEKSQLTRIMTATNTASRPITINPAPARIDVATDPAITPDGKTIYVSPSFASDYLVPVQTATDKAGKPIRLSAAPSAIVITP
jgi:DNA-binding beta-propeller fold protein YncE